VPDRRGNQQWLSQREETNQVHEVKRFREGNDSLRREAFGPSGGAGEERTGRPVRYEPVTQGERTG